MGWLLAVLAVGCDSSPPAPDGALPPVRPAAPLRVLVLDDPPLAAEIERQWRARSDAGITVQQRTSAEIVDFKRLAADVVVYPSALLGSLAERRLIVPLDSDTLARNEYDSADVLDLQGQETSWGPRTYAVSFGSPQLVLMYRVDWFEKLDLRPPTTWVEYQQLVERLARDPRGDGLIPSAPAASPDLPEGTWSATAEPLGPGWAGQMLLARSASYARHPAHFSTLFELDSMRPLIAGPPFERALAELVAAAQQAPLDATTLTPADTRRRFLAGRCAMALSWPTATEPLDGEPNAGVHPPIGFAELPAARDVFDFDGNRWETRPEGDDPHVPLLAVAGRLGSVTRETTSVAASLNVLAYLTSQDLAGSVSPASEHTTLFRVSQSATAAKWMPAGSEATAITSYAEVVARTQTRRSWLFALRIPGRSEYLVALDEAVKQAVAGQQTPARSLQIAAERWTEITKRLGVDAQRTAYRHNLGLE